MNAQSHMHARGVGYAANLLDASGAQVQEIYTTTTWEHVVAKQMNPPLPLSAGQMIDFRCNYMNNEDPRDQPGTHHPGRDVHVRRPLLPEGHEDRAVQHDGRLGWAVPRRELDRQRHRGRVATAGCLQAATGGCRRPTATSTRAWSTLARPSAPRRRTPPAASPARASGSARPSAAAPDIGGLPHLRRREVHAGHDRARPLPSAREVRAHALRRAASLSSAAGRWSPGCSPPAAAVRARRRRRYRLG